MGCKLVRLASAVDEEKKLAQLLAAEGSDFTGSDYHPLNRKEWMKQLDLSKVRVRDVIWPGTHDSATNKIGVRYVTRPFAECQTLSIYEQLLHGVRVLDIRVEKNGFVCHGVITSYKIDVVISDVKRFLLETSSEFVVLEIRTEYGHDDPPNMDKWLIGQLEESLIPQSESVFDMTLQELLPRRLFCVWKPSKAPIPPPDSPLWSYQYLIDDWTNTDLPYTKFENNMAYLAMQPPVSLRNYFYRVENTCTPQETSAVTCVKPVTSRIQPYARLFISQAYKKGLGGHLQIFSSDFIKDDFIDACIGAMVGRIKG